MDVADAKRRKREAEEEVLEVLRELERDSGLAVDRIKMRTVEYPDGSTSTLGIEIEVNL
jgi:predicted translin family RNA/ssDNA-binding protein